MSSLDCNKTAQPEASSFDRIIFPETPSRDPVITQPSTSAHLGRHSLDLRDVVKGSMYREARGLSVKTTAKEEAMSHGSKSADGSYRFGNKGKKNAPPADLKESLRVPTKLNEAPWNYNETKEHLRSSYEEKNGSWHTIPKDAPRFSFDGWESNHLSFESRDTIKSIPNLKELPRLSLDSRVFSVRGSNIDSRSNYLSKDLESSSNSNNKIFTLHQSLKTQKRPPGVVAKLMGLEALPDSEFTSHSQLGLINNSLVEHDDSFSRSLKTNDLNRPIRIPKSQRNSVKDPISPRWKNPDLVMKPISRMPIEPAPWKQLDGGQSSLKQPFQACKSSWEDTKFVPFSLQGSDSLRTYESPIVIIKTAKLVEKSDSKKGSKNSQTAKDRSPKTQPERFLSQLHKPKTQSNKQPTEVGSPGGKHRSDGTIFDLKTDMEVTSTERSTDNYSGQRPTLNAASSLVSGSLQKVEINFRSFEEDGTSAELAFVAPEHPSPVSVLDASVYRDDALSPVKKIPNMIKGDGPKDVHEQQSEDQWNPADNLLSNSVVPGLSSDINRKKLQKIENLVQKLRQLNSTHDEASTDYIASLCENTNPDHRYISEILLASGLLLRDLSSGLSTFQLHPSGHPINPELFFVLEQTKASNLVSQEECSPGESFHSKTNPEKFHRKLIFDAVNEILVKKVSISGALS
ncbi:hypothetical protein OIU84_008184 [Salix udensis]|uniref:DUF3741 domain-containing protein n=1 Tax=Salix udensis TaxID=889485 RepID=A0AAD6NZY0_9ROSI|nr:hypothetical protein OIU84_008184 [Salix udensis]